MWLQAQACIGILDEGKKELQSSFQEDKEELLSLMARDKTELLAICEQQLQNLAKVSVVRCRYNRGCGRVQVQCMAG